MKIVTQDIRKAPEQVIAHVAEKGCPIFKHYSHAIDYPKPGTISLKGDKTQRRVVNMGILQDKDVVKCLERISRIKGLKSIAFLNHPILNHKLCESIEKQHITVTIYKRKCHICSNEPLFSCVCGKDYCLDCGLDQGPFEDYYEYCVACQHKEITKVEDILKNIPRGWEAFFEDNSSIVKKISTTIEKKIRGGATIYPPMNDIFNAFFYCQPKDIKAVIIGQDCYHGKGQAMGLSFSVRKGVKPPPSLINIYKEMKDDGFNIKDESCGDLSKWAKNGVFMYNTALTVEEGNPGSHIDVWSKSYFSSQVIKYINYNCKNVVFILWGKHAKSYKEYIGLSHHIIESAHPSFYSADTGFFGSRPFSRTNEYLKSVNVDPIDWNL